VADDSFFFTSEETWILCYTKTSNIEMTCTTCRMLLRDLLLRRQLRPLLLHFTKELATLRHIPRREGRKRRLMSTTCMRRRTQQRLMPDDDDGGGAGVDAAGGGDAQGANLRGEM
jgi:hypothetical protein